MIAAKVAMVDLVVELNLPLSTLVRVNKVFKKSLRIQTLLKGQLKMILFLVLSSSFYVYCSSFLSLGVGMSVKGLENQLKSTSDLVNHKCELYREGHDPSTRRVERLKYGVAKSWL